MGQPVQTALPPSDDSLSVDSLPEIASSSPLSQIAGSNHSNIHLMTSTADETLEVNHMTTAVHVTDPLQPEPDLTRSPFFFHIDDEQTDQRSVRHNEQQGNTTQACILTVVDNVFNRIEDLEFLAGRSY